MRRLTQVCINTDEQVACFSSLQYTKNCFVDGVDGGFEDIVVPCCMQVIAPWQYGQEMLQELLIL